jgi:hypothetical protein
VFLLEFLCYAVLFLEILDIFFVDKNILHKEVVPKRDLQENLLLLTETNFPFLGWGKICIL